MRLSKLRSFLTKPVTTRVVIALVAGLCIMKYAVVPAFYDFDMTLRELPFGMGPPTEAIARTGSMLTCPAPGAQPSYCAFAARMPLMPYVFAALSKIVGDDVLRIAVLKTLLLDLLLIVFLARFVSTFGADRFILALFCAVFSGPQFMLHSFSPFYEEGFLIQLLAVIAATQVALLTGRGRELWRWSRILAYVCVCAGVYLIKSSMILVLVWSILSLFLFVRIRPGIRFAVALAMCLPVMVWGSAVDRVTGRFAVGTSIDGLNLLEGNNPATENFYPEFSLDLVIGEGPIEVEGRMIDRFDLRDLDPRFTADTWADEWQPDDALRTIAIRWALAHPRDELRLLARKIEVFFLDIRNSPKLPWHPKPPLPVLMAGMAWMAAMRAVLWCAIAASAIAVRRPGVQRGLGVGFLGFLAAYCAPYVVGYGFERHVVPVLLPAAIYLAGFWRLRFDRIDRAAHAR